VTNENELSDLRERIGRLSGADQVWLLEAVLADNRRRYEELVAEMRAAEAEFRKLEKEHGKVLAPAPFNFSPETKREAG
jgi:hypothetical protein